MSKIGINKFSCKEVAVEELRERLIALQNAEPIRFVALLGENNNLLALGPIFFVGDGTVLIGQGAGFLDYTVNLCCVCSIVDSRSIDILIEILGILGVITSSGVTTLNNLFQKNNKNCNE